MLPLSAFYYQFIVQTNFPCFVGAKKSRDVVLSVLRDACIDGDLSISEAVEAVNDMFTRNAVQLYKMNLTIESFMPNSSAVSIPLMKTNVVQEDVKFVRIIWVDGSGQQRCRVSFLIIILSLCQLVLSLGCPNLEYLYFF